VSAVPFHMWTPDVYQGAPTCVTALFAIVPKVAAMALLMHLLLNPFMSIHDQWMQIIWFLSAGSMLVGAFAAIAQENIKRLMAYSSIGHMGYALIGLVVATPDSAGALILYMFIYMIMTAGTFIVILAMRREDKQLKNISDLSGLAKNNPALAYAMAIFMFSMSGIPPLAGFFGKLFIFQSAIAEGLIVLAVLGVVTSVVAAYYYLRIVKVMFFDEAADPFSRRMPFSQRTILVISVAFIVFFILRPGLIIDSTQSAAMALFHLS
jgi:NADH-quinone oxidoreductase subunit N